MPPPASPACKGLGAPLAFCSPAGEGGGGAGFSYVLEQVARLEAAIAAERAARGAMLPTVNDGGFGDTSGDDPFDLSDPFETPEQPSEVLVYYSFDSAEIPMDFDAELEMLAMRLSDDPDAKALIEGHADDSGARNYNNTLSLERAEAIKRRLVQQYAVNPDQIELIEFGEDRPQKTLPEEQPQNRRAVILIE